MNDCFITKILIFICRQKFSEALKEFLCNIICKLPPFSPDLITYILSKTSSLISHCDTVSSSFVIGAFENVCL